MASLSSTLGWRIPWTDEPGKLQSMGSQRIGHIWATSLSLFIFMHWGRKWQSSVLTWRIPGTAEPGGLSSMGLHSFRHDWSDLASAVWTTGNNLDLPLASWLEGDHWNLQFVPSHWKLPLGQKHRWQPRLVNGIRGGREGSWKWAVLCNLRLSPSR